MTSPVSAIEAIEKAMEGVTPGPWQIEGKYVGDLGSLYLSTMHPSPIFELVPLVGTEGRHIANAQYLAACSPVAMREVLALARQAEALQQEVDSLKQTRQHSREASAALHDAFMEERKRVEALQRENAEKDAEIVRLRRLAADRSYMMKAYRDMLGPTGLEVAEMWERKGVTRQHTDWGPKAYALSGEERAQVLLDADKLIGSPVNSIDTPDFGARALLGGENAE